MFNTIGVLDSTATITKVSTMFVVKRGSRGTEPLKFDKITERIRRLAARGNLQVQPETIALQVIKNIYNGIHVEELDNISASVSDGMKLEHPDYGTLAGYIKVSNLHKTTSDSFSQTMYELSDLLGIFDSRAIQFIVNNANTLDSMIDHSADYMFDYNAMLTLEKQFLHRIDSRTHVYDRPQYMFMRVALQVCMVTRGVDMLDSTNTDHTASKDLIARILEVYNGLSRHQFTYATPTNFNSLTAHAQLNSCFLLSTVDSIEEIMRTITNTALISKRAGGIGIAMSNIRTRGSDIKGTNGISDGVFPQLKIYDANVLCWNQGGGKRKGAVAIYVELWNADIMQILQLKLSQGSEEIRARNLFYAVWVCDLFMKRLFSGKQWSLFSEDTAPGLSKVFDGMLCCVTCGRCENKDLIGLKLPIDVSYEGAKSNGECNHNYSRRDVFTELYEYYERIGLAREVCDPAKIEDAICLSQRESGGPYVCFKDHANRQSNHQGIGTLTSSNLCAEIYEWHNENSYACCSLASINLVKFISSVDSTTDLPATAKYDFDALHRTVKLVVRGLDNNVTANDYPVTECSTNALQFRPIAVGVQGLADLFCKLKLPYLSKEAEMLDLRIFETIYHAALEASCELAEQYGAHSDFQHTPLSRGILRQDLWIENQARLKGEMVGSNNTELTLLSPMYDWDAMRERVKSGVRCSLHVALMPTVTTSHIFGNNESFEPLPNLLYTKNTLAGKLTVCNLDFQRELIARGLWTEDLRMQLVNNGGSCMNITDLPMEVREVYRSVWEMSQSELMRRAALRHAYIDQGQSLNIHSSVNTDSRLRAIFRAGYKYGLNTGSYYIRTKATVDPLKNNIAVSSVSGGNNTSKDAVCDPGCMSCGS